MAPVAYALTSDPKWITRTADGAAIPVDTGNGDYQLYLAWLAAGNTVAPVPVPSADVLAVQHEAALQVALDAGAQSWGYDSVVSAASYAASTHAQFKSDAGALISWRDSVWLWAQAQEAAIKAGTEPMPATVAAFVANMPALPTHTIVS